MVGLMSIEYQMLVGTQEPFWIDEDGTADDIAEECYKVEVVE